MTVPTDKMKWALDSAISLSIARGMPGVAEGLNCAKVQLQQLQEELDHYRSAAKHWQDRYDTDADRLPAALVELEQVKKERGQWEQATEEYLSVIRSDELAIQSLRSELSAKDNVNVEVRKGLKGIADAVGVAIGYGERIDNGLLMDELVRLHSILAQVAKEGDGH